MSTVTRYKGSAIAEFGPALFLLFIALFFPMVDMASVAFKYCACANLNDLQTRKAALLPKSESNGPAMTSVVTSWSNSGLGAFVNLSTPPTTQISYDPPFVMVETSCSVTPLLQIPFFSGIPGLGAPITLQVKSKRILEDPSNFGK